MEAVRLLDLIGIYHNTIISIKILITHQRCESGSSRPIRKIMEKCVKCTHLRCVFFFFYIVDVYQGRKRDKWISLHIKNAPVDVLKSLKIQLIHTLLQTESFTNAKVCLSVNHCDSRYIINYQIVHFICDPMIVINS